MHHILFVRYPSPVASLSELAEKIFSLLHLTETEERDSSNHVDGHYFIGYAANASVSVSRSDDSTLDDYPYWVELRDIPARENLRGVLSTQPEAIAADLANGGFQVFMPSAGWGKVGWVPSGKTFGARR